MAGRSPPTQARARRRGIQRRAASSMTPPIAVAAESRWTLVVDRAGGPLRCSAGVHALAETPRRPSHLHRAGGRGGRHRTRPSSSKPDQDDHSRSTSMVQVGSVAAGRVRSRLRRSGLDDARGRSARRGGRSVQSGGRHGAVTDWSARQAAAAAYRGRSARYLADSVRDCVAAVGPGAGTGRSQPDGQLAGYSTPAAIRRRRPTTVLSDHHVDAGNYRTRSSAGSPPTTSVT